MVNRLLWKAVLPPALCALFVFFADEARADLRGKTPYEIAAQFAPVILHETGVNPKADAITNFDFDGDWAADNNWDNLSHFGTPSYVYYSVVESDTHYFIAYALFHPRDYSSVCVWFVCHENDMEGAFITVQKQGDSGIVKLVETKAHTGMPTTDKPFYIDGQFALRVQKQGHGVYPLTEKKFLAFKKKNNILRYDYKGVAEDPNGAKNGSFGYELLPIVDTLWAHRYSIGKGQTFLGEFEHAGERYQLGVLPDRFAGRKYAGPVSPPWKWNGAGKTDADWFFDPAFYRRNDKRVGVPFSTNYIQNPYVR
jgi:hypothetical protein